MSALTKAAHKMVKTVPFGNSGIDIPQPGFGAMGLSSNIGNPLTEEQAEPLLLRAVELGCIFWDTAVRYIHLAFTIKLY